MSPRASSRGGGPHGSLRSPLLIAAFRTSAREAWALAVVAALIRGASTARYYALFIGPLGPAFVVIARLDRAAADRVRERLGHLASDNKVYVLAGVTLVDSDHGENRAWLFAPSGELNADYAKHHLIPGLEGSFAAGKDFSVRAIGTGRVGIAICKDMDFPTLGRRYAALGVDALLVPAWDFELDAWWHARMAVLRRVESGFAVVRAARNGLLTVSDRYGRVVDVVSSSSAPVTSRAALAPLASGKPTVYARLGDIFGWLCVVASGAAWLASLRRRGMLTPRR